MASDVPTFDPIPDSRPGDERWPPMTWPPAPGVALAGRIVTLTVASPSDDGEGLFRALDHPEVWTHLSRPRPADPDAVAARLEGDLGEGRVPWTVRMSGPYRGFPAGEVAGTSSYLDVSEGDARLEIGATAYAPAVWGSGVNPETKLLLLGHAFDALGAGRVSLVTDVRNVRSQRAIARLGARYEGTMRRHKRRPDGTLRDTVLFSIVAEDWPKVRARLKERVAVAPR